MNKSSSFKKLQQKWYDKLKADGFKDIERADFSLKAPSLDFSSQKSMNSWQAKQEYYYIANHFLNTYRFETKLEQVIWEYHANGISVRNIAKILNDTKVLKTNRTTVWQVVKRLREIMRLNIYEHKNE